MLPEHGDLGHPLPHAPGAAGRTGRGVGLELGNRVHAAVAAGHADLDRAEVVEVARHGGLRGVMPSVGEELDELRLAGHLVVHRSAG